MTRNSCGQSFANKTKTVFMSSSTSSNVKCPNCDGKEVELDSQMGHVVCIGCGTVLELNTMVQLGVTGR